MLRNPLVLFALFIAFGPAIFRVSSGQDVDEEVREVSLLADSLSGAIENGERVRRLYGNVLLRQDETTLRAAEATEYRDRDQILFRGRVRIVDKGDTLRAARIDYNKTTKTGRAYGRVVLSDGDVVVESPTAIHEIRTKFTRFEGGVRLVDSTSVLTSDAGRYWSEEKRAVFVGNVTLNRDRSVIHADSLVYLRDLEIADAFGNVRFERVDTTDEDGRVFVYMFGQRAHTDEPGDLSRLDGDVLLIRISVDSTDTPTDTMAVRARRITTTEKAGNRTVVAGGDVKVWKADVAAVADSMVVVEHEATDSEEVLLYNSPSLWFERTQVAGDTMRVVISEGEIDSLYVMARSFLGQEDSLGAIQQVQGVNLTVAFAREEQHFINVGPNAEAIYYMFEDGSLSGAVRTSADRIFFHIREEALDQIKGFSGIEGTYYPEHLIPDSFRLSHFAWSPDRKPTRPTFFADPRLQRLGVRIDAPNSASNSQLE